MKAKFSNPKMMNTKDLEKQIVNVLKINSNYDWDNNLENTPNQEFKDLIKLVKKLFNEYRGERLYTTNTILGLLKGDK